MHKWQQAGLLCLAPLRVVGLPLVAVEAVPVLEGLVADGAGHGALHAVLRLEVAPVHPSDHLGI